MMRERESAGSDCGTLRDVVTDAYYGNYLPLMEAGSLCVSLSLRHTHALSSSTTSDPFAVPDVANDMDIEPGDEYIRRTAAFIRDNEARLAQAGAGRRRKAQSVPNASLFNPLGWVGLADNNASITPVVLSLDTHHLFYLLMRLEGLGIDVGSLDVQVDDLSRPLSYMHLGLNGDKSETLSIAESFKSSLSAVSRLSLGSGWWGKTEIRDVETELKYIYSSFTKLPALSIGAPGPKIIAELAQDPPLDSAIPLDSFKCIMSLECLDVDPRALLGWDRLAESLRSLTIKRGGLDNPANIFVDAVIDDQLRREGDATRSRIRKLEHRISTKGFHSSNLPETVQEESEDELASSPESPSINPLLSRLSPLKWAFLKHLCLADNALTTFPSSILPTLTSITHLDLSTNLLVSIPQLSTLYNLVSLNLSDNMIESVLGIYTKLGQVLTLNLSNNRLDSICGLERLVALERVDLRSNRLEESAEVGRLAVLPNIAEVWVEKNPFIESEENHRINCFEHFWKEGKSIVLDGSLPTYFERRNRTAPTEQTYPSRLPAATYSPPSAPVSPPINGPASTTSANSPVSGASSPKPSPGLPAVVTKPKKRNKRIVALDGGSNNESLAAVPRSSTRSRSPLNEDNKDAKSNSNEGIQIVKKSSPRRSRHTRNQTVHDAPVSSTPPASSPPLSGSLGRQSGAAFTRRGRGRTSTSIFDPPPPVDTGFPRMDVLKVPDGSKQQHMNANDDGRQFRAKIEALREEMGDNWLQVLSQSQFRTGTPVKR